MVDLKQISTSGNVGYASEGGRRGDERIVEKSSITEAPIPRGAVTVCAHESAPRLIRHVAAF